jgi:hypothetical protein
MKCNVQDLMTKRYSCKWQISIYITNSKHIFCCQIYIFGLRIFLVTNYIYIIVNKKNLSSIYFVIVILICFFPSQSKPQIHNCHLVYSTYSDFVVNIRYKKHKHLCCALVCFREGDRRGEEEKAGLLLDGFLSKLSSNSLMITEL